MTEHRELTRHEEARFANGTNLSDQELSVLYLHLNNVHGQKWWVGTNFQFLGSRSEEHFQKYWEHCRALHDGEITLEELT